MKGGAVVSVWHMAIIAGANTHDHDVFSMKDSLLVFQAFICCEWLLGRNLLYEYYVFPTLAAGLRTSGATRDSVIFIIPTECVSMTEGDLFFSPMAFTISHHLLKMHQTFAFGNPPLLSQLLFYFFCLVSINVLHLTSGPGLKWRSGTSYPQDFFQSHTWDTLVCQRRWLSRLPARSAGMFNLVTSLLMSSCLWELQPCAQMVVRSHRDARLLSSESWDQLTVSPQIIRGIDFSFLTSLTVGGNGVWLPRGGREPIQP